MIAERELDQALAALASGRAAATAVAASRRHRHGARLGVVARPRFETTSVTV